MYSLHKAADLTPFWVSAAFLAASAGLTLNVWILQR